jgi:serine/threonine protein kinase
MIGKNREAVLIDFGLSANYDLTEVDKKNEYLSLRSGTYTFFAPELFMTGE